MVRLSAKSEGRGIGLAGADANRMVEVDDEDLAVADLAGLGGRGDRVDGLVDLIGIDGDFDLDLGQEAHGVFGAAIDFRVAFLPAISLDFGHREPVNADGGQGITDFFELEWLDDRHNNFHGFIPAWTRHPRAVWTDVPTRRSFTTRAQPRPVESNAVPERRHSLTVYESGRFRSSAAHAESALFRRA